MVFFMGKRRHKYGLEATVVTTPIPELAEGVALDTIPTSTSEYSTPLDFLAGVMDEEVSPLLKNYLLALKQGEGALVVYRLKENQDPDHLLESTIQIIAGRGWQCVSGKLGNDSDLLQNKIDQLTRKANLLRAPIELFTQGTQKIKAENSYRICFGIVGGPKSGTVKSIRGIVHQQLNMGVNGDLILNEADVIFQALIECGVFKENNKDRPIHVKTYGAGGSTHESMVPGKLGSSDGVIDIRTHIRPQCVISYLENYLLDNPVAPSLDKDQKLTVFKEAKEELLNKISTYNYSGLEMVHDVGHLVNLFSEYAGAPATQIMENFRPEDKQYYGEVTFGTPYHGATTVYRMDTNAEGQFYSGDKGQVKLLQELRDRFFLMSRIKDERRLSRSALTGDHVHKHDDINKMLRKYKWYNSNEQKKNISEYREKVEIIMKTLEECQHICSCIQDCPGDEQLVVYKQDIAALQSRFMSSIDLSLNTTMPTKMKALFERLVKMVNDKMDESSNLVLLHRELLSADNQLRYEIKKYTQFHQRLEPTKPFEISGCGAFFFTDPDKRAMAAYGTKSAEMENQLFVQMVNYCILNNLYVENQYISKLAADPMQIEPEVSQNLNKWAKEATMTVDEYVAAFMWAKNGQHVDAVPECGRWGIAEELACNGHEAHFYTFGEGKILNPFWKEIGTDLVSEIIDGKAFQGNIVIQELNKKTPEEVKAIKSKLQYLARQLKFDKSIPPNDDNQIIKLAHDLFSQYLEFIGAKVDSKQHKEKPEYRIYARRTAFSPNGYVTSGVDDWDSSLYKSANTIMLADLAGGFLRNTVGKQLGEGAIIVSPVKVTNNAPNPSSPQSVLRVIREALKNKEYQKAMDVGLTFVQKTLDLLSPMKTDEATALDYIKHTIIDTREILNLTETQIEERKKRLLIMRKEHLAARSNEFSSINDIDVSYEDIDDSDEKRELTHEKELFVKEMSGLVADVLEHKEISPAEIDKLSTLSKEISQTNAQILSSIDDKYLAVATPLSAKLSAIRKELLDYLEDLSAPKFRNIYRDERQSRKDKNMKHAINLLYVLNAVDTSQKLCRYIERAKYNVRVRHENGVKSTEKLKEILERGLRGVKPSPFGFFKPILVEPIEPSFKHDQKHGHKK